MRARANNRLVWLAASLVLAGGVLALLPVTAWIEERLAAILVAKGAQDVTLKVGHIGLRGIELKDVSIGRESPLILKKATIDYSLSGLRNKTLGGVTLSGLALNVYERNDSLALRGLEANDKASQAPKEAIQLPLTHAAFAAFPLTKLSVEESTLTLDAFGVKGTFPIALEVKTIPTETLHYSAPQWQGSMKENTLNTGSVTLDLALNESQKQWEGTWSIDAIHVADTPIPELNAKGTLHVMADKVVLSGTATDAKKNYHAAFELAYGLTPNAKSTLVLRDVKLPWHEGVVGLDKATIALKNRTDTNLTITVQNVSIAELMKDLTGERATGTGKVSGTIPLTIHADGKVTLHPGKLRAVEPGVIAITPETIPGDNAQLGMVRDVLKNLHYTTLSLAVQPSEGNAISVLLAVEGRNPELANSRPVRLNVHLTGDVLELVQQNIRAFTAPQRLLENPPHETRP